MDNLTIPAAQRSSFSHLSCWIWTLLLAGIVPWLCIRSQQATNSDILWLCEALSRYLNGHKLSEAAYEVNPPLSMLLYVMPVLAQKILHLPLHYMVFLQTNLLAAITTLATYRILTSWKFLHYDEIIIITAAFLVTNTVGSSLYFGERDHMIGLVLLPFLLLQLSLTYDWPRPRGWTVMIFVLGTVLMLVKPHYGLLPTLLLLHRIYRQRNFSALRDIDFIILAAGTAFYMILVAYAFPDYIAVIMPDVIKLYIPLGRWPLVGETIINFIALSAALSIGVVLMNIQSTKKKILFLFIAAALINLVPYYVQGLGFYYHLLPSLSFLAPALILTLFYWIKNETGGSISIFLTIVFILSIAHIFSPLNSGYPRHQDYASLPLSKILQQDCPRDKPCGFLMFNRDMAIIHETAYYTHRHHASRFPSFWFLPGIRNAGKALKEGKPSLLTTAEVRHYFLKYSTMVAEDLVQDPPDLIFVWKSEEPLEDQNFIRYFSANPAFRQAWSHYKKIETFSMRYSDYYNGSGMRPLQMPLYYDVYRRVDPHDLL